MSKEPQRLAVKVLASVLVLSLAMVGCGIAEGRLPAETPEPIPSTTASTPPTDEPSASDLWSDDRSRIDTPLLSAAALDPEIQWAIFEACGQDAGLFCATMAIAKKESRFTFDLVGDDGKSVGMMQINTKWHTGRMEALGVTDLTDPVQCAMVAIDYLKELEAITGATPEDHALYMAYNLGPSGARKAMEAGLTSTKYSEAVLALYHEYMEEMEWAG